MGAGETHTKTRGLLRTTSDVEEVRPEGLEEARRVHGDGRTQQILLGGVADDGEHRDPSMFDLGLVHALAAGPLHGVHAEGVELQIARLERLGAVLEP